MLFFVVQVDRPVSEGMVIFQEGFRHDESVSGVLMLTYEDMTKLDMTRRDRTR